MEKEVAIHRVRIDKYELIEAKLKKVNEFLIAGSITAIVLIFITAFYGSESLKFAADMMGLISISLAMAHMIALTCLSYLIGLRYKLISKAMRASIERTQEWARSQMKL